MSCLVDEQFRGSRSTRDLTAEHAYGKLDGMEEDASAQEGGEEGGKAAREGAVAGEMAGKGDCAVVEPAPGQVGPREALARTLL